MTHILEAPRKSPPTGDLRERPKKKWRATALTALLGGLCCAQVATTTFAGRKAWRIASTGATVVRTTFAGQPLVISIHAWPVHVEARLADPPQPYPQCTYSQDPCSITDRIAVRLGGRSLWVDASTFSDLTDMHYLSVSARGGQMDLIIGGGDGMASYDAHFVFNRGRIVKRILYDGPAENFISETTEYHYQVIGD